MKLEYFKHYDELIETYEEIFHLKSNESDSHASDLVSNILISKFHLDVSKIITSLLIAIKFNYRSTELYVNLLNQISNQHNVSKFSSSIIGYLNKLGLKYSTNADNICQIECDKSKFPKENEIEYIVMYDQIDKFKEYITNKSIRDFNFEIPGLSSSNDIMETCCYFGSVNIFMFLLTNLNYKIKQVSVQYSFIGGNIDIINECLKNHKLDKCCFDYIVSSHNNKFLEYCFERDLLEFDQNIYEHSILSQNLKFVFLMFEKDKNSIIPWGAGFKQTLEILKNEDLDLSETLNHHDILYYASAYNNVDICEFILESTKADNIESDKVKALMIAAENNNKELAELLIKNGVDVKSNPKGLDESILYIALKNASLGVADILISHGSNINERIPSSTALHQLVSDKNYEAIDFLLSHGVKINKKDIHGQTALHYAALRYNERIIQLLISHGSDLNAQDNDGKTSLHAAIKDKCYEAAKFLILHGADINLRDHNRKTVLHYAVDFGNKEIIELLISHGAKINAKDNLNQTVLHYSVENNCIELVELFISLGVDVNAKNNYGKTALHAAIKNSNQNMVDFLISHGANVNSSDYKGRRPIHYAAKYDDSYIMEYLISHGANINKLDFEHKTVLHHAAKSGDLTLIDFLTSLGVDTDAVDDEGYRYIDYLEEHIHLSLIDILT